MFPVLPANFSCHNRPNKTSFCRVIRKFEWTKQPVNCMHWAFQETGSMRIREQVLKFKLIQDPINAGT